MEFLKECESAGILERKLMDEHLELLDDVRSRIRSVEAVIEQLKQDDEVVQRLESIPGVGKFLWKEENLVVSGGSARKIRKNLFDLAVGGLCCAFVKKPN